MTVHLRPEARRDILEAANWYQDRDTGLGLALIAEIEAVFLRIEQGPLRFPVAHRQLRQARCHRFPFSVYFAVEKAGILVFGVMHHRRDRKVLDERIG